MVAAVVLLVLLPLLLLLLMMMMMLLSFLMAMAKLFILFRNLFPFVIYDGSLVDNLPTHRPRRSPEVRGRPGCLHRGREDA